MSFSLAQPMTMMMTTTNPMKIKMISIFSGPEHWEISCLALVVAAVVRGVVAVS
jgi:hypothetical protein